MAGSPHDSLFKRTFGVPAQAAEELRAVLPASLVALVDWTSFKPEPGEFVDESLRGRHTDLLFSASAAGRPTLLYVLFEHQSEPDPLMPLRLFIYFGRIWSAWLQRNPRGRAVPPIVPVVLHHGVTGWTAARELHDLYDAAPELLDAAEPYLPRLTFLLDDLAEHSDEAIRARALSALVTLVLLTLKHARRDDALDETLSSWLDLIEAVATAPHGIDAIKSIITYVFEVSEAVTVEGVAHVLHSALNEAPETVMTLAERLRAEGRTQGLQQGLQQGLEQGIEQGIEQGLQQKARELLVRLVERRFGELPDAIAARIANAPLDDLDRWADQFATAATLDDVFDENG